MDKNEKIKFGENDTSIKIVDLAKKEMIDDNYKDTKKILTEFKTNITRQEFEAYEEVRVSGVTNMFCMDVVSKISKLSIEKIKEIMFSYDRLKKKYSE